MRLSECLAIAPGENIAVVGCGGKTSVVGCLARENAARGVLIAPTARIALSEAVPLPGVRYLGRPEGEKLAAAPVGEIEVASRAYYLCLMEADGSRGKPLKGWAEHEPVIPPFATMTIGVIPAWGLGLSVNAENVHRPERFTALTGLSAGGAVSAEALARMALGPGGMFQKAVGRRAILINQDDDPASEEAARRIASGLCGFSGLIATGSTRKEGSWTRIS